MPRYTIVARELIATRFQTRYSAQQMADILNEREHTFTVTFRDHDWYSITVRDWTSAFLGYVKLHKPD